jgi:hypothetical protein
LTTKPEPEPELVSKVDEVLTRLDKMKDTLEGLIKEIANQTTRLESMEGLIKEIANQTTRLESIGGARPQTRKDTTTRVGRARGVGEESVDQTPSTGSASPAPSVKSGISVRLTSDWKPAVRREIKQRALLFEAEKACRSGEKWRAFYRRKNLNRLCPEACSEIHRFFDDISSGVTP